jgi:hypothetical protein
MHYAVSFIVFHPIVFYCVPFYSILSVLISETHELINVVKQSSKSDFRAPQVPRIFRINLFSYRGHFRILLWLRLY